MKNIPTATVGGRIRLARTKAGLTPIHRLAHRVGVTDDHLGEVELGRREPSESLLRRIVDVTDTDVAWLRHGDDHISTTKGAKSMFSSNQIFDVTCDLDEALVRTIDFGIQLSGKRECLTRRDQPVRLAFQETSTGLYCIGMGSIPDRPPDKQFPTGRAGHSAGKGWTDYPFKYDAGIVAKIVAQWVQDQPAPPRANIDGSQHVGVRVMCKESVEDNGALYNGIKDPRSCILVFQPFNMEFHK